MAVESPGVQLLLDEVTDCIQVAPELVDVKISPRDVAVCFIPSAEEATENQYLLGAVFIVQVAPPLVEK